METDNVADVSIIIGCYTQEYRDATEILNQNNENLDTTPHTISRQTTRLGYGLSTDDNIQTLSFNYANG